MIFTTKWKKKYDETGHLKSKLKKYETPLDPWTKKWMVVIPTMFVAVGGFCIGLSFQSNEMAPMNNGSLSLAGFVIILGGIWMEQAIHNKQKKITSKLKEQINDLADRVKDLENKKD